MDKIAIQGCDTIYHKDLSKCRECQDKGYVCSNKENYWEVDNDTKKRSGLL